MLYKPTVDLACLLSSPSMPLRWKLMIVAAMVVAAAVYGDLVLDIRTPRARLAQSHAIGVNISIQMDDIHRAGDAMKKKYGPDAETILMTRPARMITRVSGKVVEEAKAPSQFSDAMGLFVIGPPGRQESTFPFQIDPRKAPEAARKGGPSVRSLKSRFGKEFPAKYFEFDNRDVATDRCIAMSAADLGWAGKLLRFQSGAFCIVFWRGPSSGSMLIGVMLADGDPWMRPFTRRICRWITAAALARLAATDREPPPDYAGCVLVDRPDRSGAAETLKAQAYEVRRDASLAYMN
jgi:hypothetical protein